MTTEDLIQSFIDAGRHAFTSHTAKRSPEIRKLIRHEKVVIDGHEYNCLQELVVVKTAEHIRNILPDCELEVELDGNNSTLNVELTQDEKQKLTSALYVFLKENRCIEG
ncbi:hypothetical protein DYE50_01280 [Treponema ruminis]|uniref:Uncharacterized protein n=1 Tax=Treponema ruminis TaxID=744515 RepID=A0A7W8LNG0_9SPIR|nr:hypothetical protein [Treponema ruminis]MBB5227405.1 hypothetical protein [Treponema ruminis]QSI01215.1 hypothetical protein DYE50_01280 [Treponema ruminis]